MPPPAAPAAPGARPPRRFRGAAARGVHSRYGRWPPLPALLLSGQDLAKSFGAAPLFEGLSFGIFEGDHIGLVGPNGSGKSTLLRILAGTEEGSSGTRAARRHLRVGYVPQDPAFADAASVFETLASAAAGPGPAARPAEARP